MLELFSKDWKGPAFHLFDTSHLVALGILLGVQLILIFGWKKPSAPARRIIRYTLALTLIVSELSWHWWNGYVGRWSIQHMLPLHLCSLFVWLSAWTLITGNYALYDYVYFLGIGGAIQAVLTPDAGVYGFPHFRFTQFIIAHGAIVTAGVYLTAVERLRPTWQSIRKVFITTNIYLLAILVVNAFLGSNYMFVARKPPSPTLIDLLPDWPYYILVLEAIALATFLLLYAPFAIKDWRAQNA